MLLAALLLHCLINTPLNSTGPTSVSTNEFCWEQWCSPPLPACPSGTHCCSLKQTFYEGQYYTWLCPLPEQSFQLFIHFCNTIYIKFQQLIMEKSIRNTVQSQLSPCKTQYSCNWLSHSCLYCREHNRSLRSHTSSLSQIAGNTRFPHLCKRGREQLTGMRGLLLLSCSTGPTAVGTERCHVAPAGFRRGCSLLV